MVCAKILYKVHEYIQAAHHMLTQARLFVMHSVRKQAIAQAQNTILLSNPSYLILLAIHSPHATLRRIALFPPMPSSLSPCNILLLSTLSDLY